LSVKAEVEAVRIVIAVAAVVILGGCATATQTVLSGGGVGYVVKCSGIGMNWDTCHEKARQACDGKSFAVVERTGEQVGTATQGAAATSTPGLKRVDGFGNFALYQSNRAMTIQCNES
jgi:hypothetical protein